VSGEIKLNKVIVNGYECFPLCKQGEDVPDEIIVRGKPYRAVESPIDDLVWDAMVKTGWVATIVARRLRKMFVDGILTLSQFNIAMAALEEAEKGRIQGNKDNISSDPVPKPYHESTVKHPYGYCRTCVGFVENSRICTRWTRDEKCFTHPGGFCHRYQDK